MLDKDNIQMLKGFIKYPKHNCSRGNGVRNDYCSPRACIIKKLSIDLNKQFCGTPEVRLKRSEYSKLILRMHGIDYDK
jgi:hypothetical protein